MPNPSAPRRANSLTARLLLVLLALTAINWLGTATPAAAESTVTALPAAVPNRLPCLPTNPLCALGQAADAAGDLLGDAAGNVAENVWTNAMLSLWDAGLWLLSLAFAVIDALATPDLSADGPLAGVYPVTFGIGAAVATLMALVQLGAAGLRRDGQTLGRLLLGVVQYGLVWAGYIGVAALLVTGVSGLTTGLLRSLLDIDTMAAFDPSISVERDLVDGTVATVLGISSIFLLVPASVGYLLLMLVREAALIVLAATSAISAGGLLAQTSSAWFWRSLRWFIAALLVAPVAVLVLGVGVTITEGILTGAEETSTESAVGMAVVGCLLILLGAVSPLALFRLLAFVDPGTSSGAALRSSLAASGGVMGALGKLGGGAAAAGAAVAATSGGVVASGAAAQTSGDRAQGESTADAATSGRFAGALRALAAGTSGAGRLAAGVAASASDVLASAGVGHSAPYHGQPSPGRAAWRGSGASGGFGSGSASQLAAAGGPPRATSSGAVDDGSRVADWPAVRPDSHAALEYDALESPAVGMDDAGGDGDPR